MSDKILVIGDVVLDEHIHGECTRISPECPVPVVDVKSSHMTLGAAANVAAHVTHANIECVLLFKSATYRDNSYNTFEKMCVDRDIQLHPLCLPSLVHPITIKQRVWAGNQQVCRVDRENTEVPDKPTESSWIFQIQQAIDDYKPISLIFSDYNKGTLTDNIISNIVYYCKKKDVRTVLDPKRPTFHKIKHLNVVKPNAREINTTNLNPEIISDELGSTYLLNTLGKDGMKLYLDGKCDFTIPTFAKPEEVIDVCGCGDTIAAMIGIGLFYGKDIKHTIVAANKAAWYSIRHKGTYVLTNREVIDCFGFAEEYWKCQEYLKKS